MKYQNPFKNIPKVIELLNSVQRKPHSIVEQSVLETVSRRIFEQLKQHDSALTNIVSEI